MAIKKGSIYKCFYCGAVVLRAKESISYGDTIDLNKLEPVNAIVHSFQMDIGCGKCSRPQLGDMANMDRWEIDAE